MIRHWTIGKCFSTFLTGDHRSLCVNCFVFANMRCLWKCFVTIGTAEKFFFVVNTLVVHIHIIFAKKHLLAKETFKGFIVVQNGMRVQLLLWGEDLVANTNEWHWIQVTFLVMVQFTNFCEPFIAYDTGIQRTLWKSSQFHDQPLSATLADCHSLLMMASMTLIFQKVLNPWVRCLEQSPKKLTGFPRKQ